MKILIATSVICLLAGALTAADGLYKPANSTLRVASYNVMQDRIHEGKSRVNSWARMVKGVKADVWLLQEMFYDSENPASAAEGDAFRDTVEKITGQNDWNYSWDREGRYLLTRYPIRWNKELHHRVHATWIDVPSNVSSRDLVVINVHYRTQFDSQIAATVKLIDEIKSGNHSAGIPSNVSIIVCGDFNQSDTGSAYKTLVGSKSFVDMHPSHSGASGQKKTIGSVTLDGSGKWTSIGNNRIDFMLLNTGVLKKESSFILNTLTMPQADLNTYGLKRGDVAIEPEKTTDFTSVTIACDHFAIISDFSDPSVGTAPPPPPPTTGNIKPSASFASPSGSVSVNAGSNLSVRVNATDSDGSISRVRLYKNGVELARSEGSAPYDWGLSGQNDVELQNLSAGSFTLKAVAIDNAGATGESATITVTVKAITPPPPPPPTGVNDAQFVMSEVPTSIAAGASFTAKVTYLNTGSTTWTSAAGHKLGSESPRDNTTWNPSNRALLTTSVEPGESYTFVIPCTAPSTAGSYDFQRRMVQEGVQWFGELSEKQTIVVGVATTAGNNSQFISWNVPSTVKVGQSFTVNITWLNTGSTTWTSAGLYKSGTQNPQGNKIWGETRASNMTSTASVKSGQSYTFTMNCKAPTTAGTYNFQHKMVQENVQWFGALSPNQVVNVVP